jgi:hypothetical protein
VRGADVLHWVGFKFKSGPSSTGRFQKVAIRGKARRISHLTKRLRLKLGYSHKIFLFLFGVVTVVKNKYEILILKSSSKYSQQVLSVQKKIAYNQNGFWGRLGSLITKRGKRA